MSKLYVQNFPEVLKYSGSLAAGASVSGSLPCAGYSQLVGYIYSSGSSETGSGLSIKQSVDGGTNWDINSGCLASATGFTSSCMLDTIGNAFKIRYCNGATTAACVRMLFQLKPVAGTAKMPDVDIDVISSGSVTVTGIADPYALSFGTLTAASMGGGATPVTTIASNALRRGMLVTNVSDTIGYLSIGASTGLTTTNYMLRIGVGETIEFDPPISQQAIATICGCTSKNITYQEAV